MPSSESEGQLPPKKRSRKTSSGGDESGAAGKKARGRPRVDTQDATAADVSWSSLVARASDCNMARRDVGDTAYLCDHCDCVKETSLRSIQRC